ncbi:hypothetical protein TNCV_2510221 [Trichonephila clavipes]|nr:hypothetical protein TNCV_2510221 [Trichonephila clavipes]
MGYSKQPSSCKFSREVGGRGREVGAPDPPSECSSSKLRWNRAKNRLSPVRCSRLRPTTGVHLAPCHDKYRGPRSDYVRQVAFATTT